MQEKFEQKENPLNSQEARPNFWQSLEKNQKIALIVLAVFVLFLMIAWSIQFKRSLTEPFAYKGSGVETNLTDNTSGPDSELSKKDTDLDGLSDWDELNSYKTSPYLEDSDGDGILDGVEIKNGNNPNCPEGKDCQLTDIADTNSLATITPSQLPSLDIGVASTSQTDLQQLLEGNMDAATLRKFLLDGGMDKNVLIQLSDEELLKNYKQLISNSDVK